MFVVNPYAHGGKPVGTTGLGLTPYLSVYSAANGSAVIAATGEGGSSVITSTALAPTGAFVPAYIGGPNLWASGAYTDLYQEFKILSVSAGGSQTFTAGLANDTISNTSFVGANAGGFGWYAGDPSLDTSIYYNGANVTSTLVVAHASVNDRVTVRLQNAAGMVTITGSINGTATSFSTRSGLSGNNYMAISVRGPGVNLQCTKASQVWFPIAGSAYLG